MGADDMQRGCSNARATGLRTGARSDATAHRRSAIFFEAVNVIVYPCRHAFTDDRPAAVRWMTPQSGGSLNMPSGFGAALVWRRNATIYLPVLALPLVLRQAQKNRRVGANEAAALKKGLHLAVQTLIKFWCPGEDSNLHGVTR